MNWLTVKEAAEELRISEDVMLAHIRAGRIAASNVSSGTKRNRYRITPAALKAFMESRLTLPPEPKRTARRKPVLIDYFP